MIIFPWQIQEVYETTYETCGQYWPYIHNYIVIALVIMQITMIGLFGMKAKPSASFATMPLLIVTLLFNEYCKMRFLPTFDNYSVQDAAKNDEQNGLMEDNCRKALDAYCPPFQCLWMLSCRGVGIPDIPEAGLFVWIMLVWILERTRPLPRLRSFGNPRIVPLDIIKERILQWRRRQWSILMD
ncbi:hypothetical protein POM88_053124 [Heracleum sosnowskyi]|uniref:CSC1/OSCA1-like 7TM region domain-containing protein n=1 Tax=Heracleum sosnowskyi TaxID=360622 RepID=A0AAD8GRC2_9APIA|nr:hypothetical protein POM88_053124 [Heracleum sosnowskyi]